MVAGRRDEQLRDKTVTLAASKIAKYDAGEIAETRSRLPPITNRNKKGGNKIMSKKKIIKAIPGRESNQFKYFNEENSFPTKNVKACKDI